MDNKINFGLFMIIYPLEKIKNNLPAIFGVIITSFWLAYKADKNQVIAQWLRKNIKDESGILLPSFLVIVSPFLSTRLFNYLSELSQESKLSEALFKGVLPVVTFIMGQFFTEYRRQEELKSKEKATLLELYEKFQITWRKLRDHKEQLEHYLYNTKKNNLDTPKLVQLENINSELASLTSFQGLIKGKQRLTKDKTIIVARDAVELIDKFNKELEKSKNYKSAIDTLKQSADTMKIVLEKVKLEEVYRNLLGITEQLLEVHNEFNESIYKIENFWL